VDICAAEMAANGGKVVEFQDPDFGPRLADGACVFMLFRLPSRSGGGILPVAAVIVVVVVAAAAAPTRRAAGGVQPRRSGWRRSFGTGSRTTE
jgi:hypothetical protein